MDPPAAPEPVDAHVRGTSYPAGPGWWLAGDKKWYPPPEPREPEGTVHQIGEQKPTWQGVAQWDGTAWTLLPTPDSALSHRYLADDEAYVAPPRGMDPSTVRRINRIGLALGCVGLVIGVTALSRHYAGASTSVDGALVAVNFFIALALGGWSYFLLWFNGRLPRKVIPWRHRRAPLAEEVLLMAPHTGLPVFALAVVALAPALRHGPFAIFGASQAVTFEASPAFNVFLGVPLSIIGVAVAVMLGEEQRQRARTAAAAKA
jgi:hypothetical protein